MFWLGTRCVRQNDFGSLLPSLFLGHDCLGSSRASRTGQDGQTIAIDKLSIPTRAGRDLPNHRHGLPRVSKTDGKTIHHRSWKGRIVAVGGDVFRQHQAAGCRQTHTAVASAVRYFELRD